MTRSRSSWGESASLTPVRDNAAPDTEIGFFFDHQKSKSKSAVGLRRLDARSSPAVQGAVQARRTEHSRAMRLPHPPGLLRRNRPGAARRPRRRRCTPPLFPRFTRLIWLRSPSPASRRRTRVIASTTRPGLDLPESDGIGEETDGNACGHCGDARSPCSRCRFACDHPRGVPDKHGRSEAYHLPVTRRRALAPDRAGRSSLTGSARMSLVVHEPHSQGDQGGSIETTRTRVAATRRFQRFRCSNCATSARSFPA